MTNWSEPLYGFCLNNEEHYGRLCECGACRSCCTCGRTDRRIARLKARIKSAHHTLDSICAQAIMAAQARGAVINESGGVRVRVDSSRQHGPHIRIQGWAQPVVTTSANQSAEEIADIIVAHHQEGRAAFNEWQ